MKVAYYSPMPPSTSGIADYSDLLVGALRDLVDLEIVDAPRRFAPTADVHLYHIGNNAEAHGWIVEALRARPGVVVLHEHVLHHLVAGMTIAQGDEDGYLRAMQRDAGVVGRLLAHGVIEGIVPPPWESVPGDFPLCAEVLDHATAVIAHSQVVEDAVRARGFGGAVHRINHPAWPKPAIEPDPALEGARGPTFGVFGHMNYAKRIPQAIEAFAGLLASQPDARLLLVGSEAEGLSLAPRLAEIEESSPGAVIRIGYVDEARLWNLIAAVDVCLCLRHPTMGETSGIAIRALVCGRPLVVSDVGWFRELPDGCVTRVGIGVDEVPALTAAMLELAADPDLRRAMGLAGAAYAANELDLTAVAERYRRALVSAAGAQQVREAVVHEIAAAAADVGIRPDTPELAAISERLREALP